ncbi:MAG: hypothetical protein J7L14_02655, partial [Candidatus Diapherotrites archaeon]|nr:hypothetical protein [Candidatus Diapherotrites archaeon]
MLIKEKEVKAIANGEDIIVNLLVERITLTAYTIRLKGSAGENLTGKEIRAKIICRDNGRVIAEQTTYNGLVKIIKPQDCEQVVAEIEAEGYESKTAELKHPETELRLTKITEQKKETGNIEVRLIAPQNMGVVGVRVELRNDMNALVDYTYADSCVVVFRDVKQGNYTINISDNLARFKAASAQARVISNETSEIEINLVPATQKTTIVVKDKETKTPIANARVVVREKNGKVLAEGNTNTKGEFVIAEEYGKEVLIVSSAEKYLVKEIETTLQEEIEIELTRVTIYNSRTINVTVVDDENKPVQGALVYLMDAERDSIVNLFHGDYIVTDAVGNAEFRNIPLGTYYLIATRNIARATSKKFTLEESTEQSYNIVIALSIGKTKIQVNLFPKDISATAELYSKENQLLAKKPIINGKAEFEERSDREVFVLVKSDSFATFQSRLLKLWDAEPKTVNAKMKRTEEITNLDLEFLGIYRNNQRISSIPIGSSATAIFLTSIPQEFSKAGFVFRVGNKQYVELEPIAIKQTLIADSQIMRGAFLTGDKQQDMQYSSPSEEAKWIAAEFNRPEARIIESAVEIKARPTSITNTTAKICARLWATNSRYASIPESEEPENELYGKCKSYDIALGNSECEGEVCYLFDSLFDIDSNLFMQKPYTVITNKDYNFCFVMLARTEQRNAELTIENEDNSIEFKEAEAEKGEAKIEDNKVIVNFQDKVSGPIRTCTKLRMIKATNSIIRIEFKASNVSKHVEKVNILAEKASRIAINTSAEAIAPYEETKLEVELQDADNNIPLENALLKIIVENSLIDAKQTDAEGKATFEIPSLQPGTEIKIIAEKPGYEQAERTIKVIDSLIRIQPEIIDTTLNVVTAREKIEKITAKNLAGIPLIISKISIIPEERAEALDIGRMQSMLDSQLTTLNKGEEKTINFGIFLLVENAGAREEVSGNLEITVSNPIIGKEWAVKIPFHISIESKVAAENENCIEILGITQNEFVAEPGTTLTKEFELYNMCAAEGKYIALDSLFAKIVTSELRPNITLT